MNSFEQKILPPWHLLPFGPPFIHGPTDTQLFTLVFGHIDQYLSIPFQEYQKILDTYLWRFLHTILWWILCYEVQFEINKESCTP